MPPRNALIDFGTREFICRSCLLGLQRPVRPPPRWTALPTSPRRLLASHSSNAPPTRPKSTTTAANTALTFDDQDEDRRKLMEALGLLNDEKDVSVNYFEQQKDGEIRRLDSAEAFGHSLQGDSVGGAEKLPVESMMEQLKEASHLLKLLEQVGGKDQVTKIKNRLASELMDAEEDHDDTNPESLGTGTEPIMISEEGWAGTDGQKVRHLNSKLKRIAARVTRHDGEILDHQRSSLWKAYMSTRKVLISRRNIVQSATWDLLWRALGSEVESNQNRMAHIAVLARDMQVSGATLNDEQQLLAIEAMFIDGHEIEAVDNHRRLVTTLGAKTDTALDFWQLGLRMHCLQGDIERAERITETIAELPGSKDPRFLLPFIRACAESSSSAEMGYKAYQRLRDMLGEDMTIEDYDQIISYFLTTNEADYALCIFVDMMSAGSISVKGTGRLPSTVANPFFFGKWVKRLIGLGEVEHAYKVFMLMKSKGVAPRPMQINGLLGAWLRSDSGDFMSRADAVAWEMINSRVQFVERRKQSANFSSNVRLISSGTGWPSATLETFSLLAESYSQRGLHGKMEDLWRAFRQAEIAPDAFFMNQLLFSYTRDGQGRVVMDVYHALADEHNIKADPVTFRALWMAITANRQYTIRKPEYQQHIPEVRALFAEMIRSASVFQGQEFDYQLARKILHSFRKLDDKVGLLQAARSLRKVFGFYPPEPLVLELLADTVDLERMSKSPRARKGLLLHTQSMNRFLEGRRRELENTVDLELGVPAIGDWKGQALYEFLVGKLKVSCKTSALYPSGVKHALREAAEQMGLVVDATS